MWELAAKARYDAAGIAGKPDKRTLVFQGRLDTLSKLVLLALYQASQHDGAAKVDRVRATAAEIAARCSCHRVTAQRTLAQLHRQGVLRRQGDDWILVWDVLAMLTIDPRQALR